MKRLLDSQPTRQLVLVCKGGRGRNSARSLLGGERGLAGRPRLALPVKRAHWSAADWFVCVRGDEKLAHLLAGEIELPTRASITLIFHTPQPSNTQSLAVHRRWQASSLSSWPKAYNRQLACGWPTRPQAGPRTKTSPEQFGPASNFRCIA